MFSAQSLLAGNGASVTCLRESREPITTLNLATYVTPLVVRNFWLCFKFNCEVDIWMSGVEILQKPSSGSYNVEQRESVIHISKPDGGTRINISNPFLFKVTHENVR